MCLVMFTLYLQIMLYIYILSLFLSHTYTNTHKSKTGQKYIFFYFSVIPENCIRVISRLPWNEWAMEMFVFKVFRFQRKTLLFLLGFFFLIIIIIIIILFLTDFVQRISRKRLDRFSWNFHTWYLMTKIYYTFFCFDDVTSGLEISTILWFLIGHFVLLGSPKRVKRNIWNFHGW